VDRPLVRIGPGDKAGLAAQQHPRPRRSGQHKTHGFLPPMGRRVHEKWWFPQMAVNALTEPAQKSAARFYLDARSPIAHHPCEPKTSQIRPHLPFGWSFRFRSPSGLSPRRCSTAKRIITPRLRARGYACRGAQGADSSSSTPAGFSSTRQDGNRLERHLARGMPITPKVIVTRLAWGADPEKITAK